MAAGMKALFLTPKEQTRLFYVLLLAFQKGNGRENPTNAFSAGDNTTVSDDAIRLDATSAWAQGPSDGVDARRDAGHAHDAGASGWSSAGVDFNEYGI
jgi:hypothetical protein